MEIDLWTLVAQIINLFILLFLLRRFLYIPVLKVVDARRELIKNELQNAQNERIKAQKLSSLCSEKLTEIEKEKQEILLQTHEKAAALEQQLQSQAQEAYQTAEKEWKLKLQKQQYSLQQNLQETAITCFNKMAQDALAQIADADINVLAVRKFMQKINAFDSQQRENIAAQFARANKIIVQSAYKLSTEAQIEVQDFIRREFGLKQDIDVEFAINSDLLCGICVQAKEYMVSWSLAEYVEAFKNQTEAALQNLINRG